ncbi:hypothetical protein [Streptomyces roseolus]|uniref:hypothetical protein n=1 Tax=Streptomyces roseolus TaxID=67358 RepID=UPI001674D865|nr:hypothetical protein [Streptomyces roseolus]
MEHDRAGAERGERTRTERLTEGLVVAVASVLALGLFAWPATVFGTTAWRLATGTGTTTFSRFLVPVLLLALLTVPFVPARAVFRSGRREGRARLTAAAPAALALLAGSVVPVAALCLLLVYGTYGD